MRRMNRALETAYAMAAKYVKDDVYMESNYRYFFHHEWLIATSFIQFYRLNLSFINISGKFELKATKASL